MRGWRGGGHDLWVKGEAMHGRRRERGRMRGIYYFFFFSELCALYFYFGVYILCSVLCVFILERLLKREELTSFIHRQQIRKELIRITT